MAMTKAEKAEMEHLRHSLALARAFRWPDYPVPSPMTKEEIRASLIPGDNDRHGHPQMVAVGWFQNTYNQMVEQGCSNGISHSRHSRRHTTTQGVGVMYRTEAEALRAMRHEMTRDFAEKLAKVDERIAAAGDA